MISGRIGSELAVLSVFCVLSIFLFPCVQGPYSAVHGPVTALQAFRAAARLRIGILAAALKAFSSFSAPLLANWSLSQLSDQQFRVLLPSESTTILRC